MTTLYFYKNCDTCRKAIKFLDANRVEYNKQDMVLDAPPTRTVLALILRDVAGGKVRSLFNTSGMMYREMQLRDKLPAMSDDEALDLLAANGKLIKRPLLVSERGGLIGFKQAAWEQWAASA